MNIFKAFQDLENFRNKFQNFSEFSRICMNPVYIGIILEGTRSGPPVFGVVDRSPSHFTSLSSQKFCLQNE